MRRAPLIKLLRMRRGMRYLIKNMVLKEKDLFPPLKKHFKELGYAVYAEVACWQRGIDFVAVKEDHHIAVEMKMGFTAKVIQQAHGAKVAFHEAYVAFPVKKPFLADPHDNETYWKLPARLREKIDHCKQRGIGIIQVIQPHNIIFTSMMSVPEKPYRLFDFSQYTENDDDEAGLPYQKSVSAGYYELEAIKAYVRKHPNAKWGEIFEKVNNHYSSPASLAGSMSQWRGFSLKDFKTTL